MLKYQVRATPTKATLGAPSPSTSQHRTIISIGANDTIRASTTSLCSSSNSSFASNHSSTNRRYFRTRSNSISSLSSLESSDFADWGHLRIFTTEILKILNETLNDLEIDNATAVAAAANTDTNVRFYVQHCEKADVPILTYLHPFNARNIYQQIFALRFWASILLCIHLVMMIYHSLLNCFHRVPTSQRFNRAFAVIGLIIWNAISLWITYQYYAWDQTFVHALSPVIPRIPAEFVAVLMLATTMNLSLLYELFTPITYSISYDLGPRYHHSRQGYVPAAQSENKYINGIIHQLEAPQHQLPERSSKNRPIGNHTI